jgi:hypothetical protein
VPSDYLGIGDRTYAFSYSAAAGCACFAVGIEPDRDADQRLGERQRLNEISPQAEDWAYIALGLPHPYC